MTDAAPNPDPSTLTLADEERIDQLGNAFELEWKSGGRPRIEVYLRRMSPSARSVLLLELVALEVELRARQGEHVDAADYRRRFPDEQDRAAVEAAIEMRAGRDDAKEANDLLESVPGYDLHEEIGRGGFGKVLRATRQSDAKVVAIKFMLPEQVVSEHRRRLFLREIAVTQTLRHPNIVRMLETGSIGNGFYFVMPLCDGGTLHRRLQGDRGKLSLPAAVSVLRQCLAALEHAHGMGVVHRDLKPQNVLLKRRGKKSITMLSDFGLAKSSQQAGFTGLTASGQFAGTARYMPREQVTQYRTLRPASDVWSMAAVFYRMVTGRLPREFRSDNDPVSVVLHHDAVPIRERSKEVPGALADAIDRALLDDVEQRYNDARAFRRAVEGAIGKGR